MSTQVKGKFDVKREMLPVENVPTAAMMARHALTKRFYGPLEAASDGQMLSIGTPTKGSAVYVAIERVDGTLDGKQGTFALHHTGVMDRGTPSLSLQVVPDSGTGELTGLSGTMQIDIENGVHFYTFDYSLGQ